MDLLDEWTKKNKQPNPKMGTENMTKAKDVIVEDFDEAEPIDLSEIPF